MLQMTLASPKTIKKSDVPVPKPARGEVVVQILTSGICGSDIHAYYGKHPFISLPVVPGHEFSGVICELGENIRGLQHGDRVTVMPQLFCGVCRNCKIGRYNICAGLKVIGCQSPGAMQEKLAVDAELVLKLPDEICFEQGAMLEPVSVGVHACRRVGGVKNKRVVVLGAGTIGNLTAQAARAMGAEAVLITDISDARLHLAKKCGIDYTVNIAKADLATEIERQWGADGADLFIECVGVTSAVEQAIQVAGKGTDIIIAGVFGDMTTVSMGLVQDKELSLIGTLMYTKEDWLDAMGFVESKAVLLEPLISARFPLAELAQAFEYVENNKDTALKVLIISDSDNHER
ncbi:MAG: alcohol dehydrogenase catalytic domain-containing protein [Defluviitaleaceae bacterium]|nr:alcohol dehydrogenase catalytic domain-containing protein [Defluviitaleaceae bacterium]